MSIAKVKSGLDPVQTAFDKMMMRLPSIILGTPACWESQDDEPEENNEEVCRKTARTPRHFRARNNGVLVRVNGRYSGDRGPTHDRDEHDDDDDGWSRRHHDYLNKLAVREMQQEIAGYDEPACCTCGSELHSFGASCWNCLYQDDDTWDFLAPPVDDSSYNESPDRRGPRETFICQGCGGGLLSAEQYCFYCDYVYSELYQGGQLVIAFNRRNGINWNDVQADVCPYTGQNLEYIPYDGKCVDTHRLAVAYSPNGRLRFAQGR